MNDAGLSPSDCETVVVIAVADGMRGAAGTPAVGPGAALTWTADEIDVQCTERLAAHLEVSLLTAEDGRSPSQHRVNKTKLVRSHRQSTNEPA
ncbi:MAG: hypothetical protein J07HX64_01284 [halophilic archaeon J07HX64]|nr:MAG: hypothetical protein J07HX64_01284 [halophilic archaeon J07HX64]